MVAGNLLLYGAVIVLVVNLVLLLDHFVIILYVVKLLLDCAKLGLDDGVNNVLLRFVLLDLFLVVFVRLDLLFSLFGFVGFT